MKYIIKKTKKLNGIQTVPGSKSETIRALVLGLLSRGKSEINNFLDCEDTRTALEVCKDLGAHITRKSGQIIIKSAGLPIKIKVKKINTGNSGITTKFILPIIGLRENNDLPVIFDCGKQMRARPIISLVNALNNLGMKITFLKKYGACPLSVKGALVGGITSVDGAISQYLSALLLSLPLSPSDSIITVKNLQERPYVEMTLQYLDNLGISYSHRKVKNNDIYKIKGRQKYTGFKKNISGDFSSASCVIVAGCLIKGKIVLEGLDLESSQGDKKLIEILKKMGADIKISKTKIIIVGGKKLIGVSIDANNIPDLVPALAVIGTYAKGKTKIYNVAQARIKETDRIKSMSLGLRQMGAKVEEHRDGLTIYESALAGCVIKGFNDHRTVMAFVIAGMIAQGQTTVTDAEAVNKTFPNFYQLMKALGANIELKKIINYMTHSIKTQAFSSEAQARRGHGEQSRTMKHLILIGYKSVGKSAVGRELAREIKLQFVDLDEEMEKIYKQEYGAARNCRQIMLAIGQDAFRELEHKALKIALKNTSRCVISLGGGAPLLLNNKILIKDHLVMQITAPKNIVFERIMINGKPAFFPDNEHPLRSFNRTWDNRGAVYDTLASIKIDNSGNLSEAVRIIRKKINYKD